MQTLYNSGVTLKHPPLVSPNLPRARRSRQKRLWGGTSTPLPLAGRELVPTRPPPRSRPRSSKRGTYLPSRDPSPAHCGDLPTTDQPEDVTTAGIDERPIDWRPRAERAKRNQRKVANLPNRTSSPSSAVVVGMPTRITLRLMGAANGKKASLPIGATLADLLALATTKLALPQPAKRVFDASGDELDDDEDGAR